MKVSLAITTMLMLLGLVGCKEHYTSKTVYAFMQSCITSSGNTAENCGCLSDNIQNKISEKEYLEEDAKVTIQGKVEGKMAGILAKAIVDCNK